MLRLPIVGENCLSKTVWRSLAPKSRSLARPEWGGTGEKMPEICLLPMFGCRDRCTAPFSGFLPWTHRRLRMFSMPLRQFAGTKLWFGSQAAVLNFDPDQDRPAGILGRELTPTACISWRNRCGNAQDATFDLVQQQAQCTPWRNLCRIVQAAKFEFEQHQPQCTS